MTDYYHGHAITMSGRTLPDDVIKATVKWAEKADYCLLVVEQGKDQDHPHIHAACIWNTRRKVSNTKALLKRIPAISDWESANSKHAIKVTKMYNSDWLTDYLNKEAAGRTFVDTLPDDLADLNFAWPGKPKEKDPNSMWSRWKRLYKEDGRPEPASETTVYEFFHHHMYVTNTLAICADMKKLKDKCLCLREFINAEKWYCDTPAYNGQKHLDNDLPNVWKEKYYNDLRDSIS